MIRRLLCLLVLASSSAGAATDPAERPYQEARSEYQALKKDPARQKLRHAWLNVATRFEKVATSFPRSERAGDALFTAGEVCRELGRRSKVESDLHCAAMSYQRLLSYPRHRLADDAALALARLDLEALDAPEEARRVLRRAIAELPRGDRFHELKALWSTLPPPPREAPVAAARKSGAHPKGVARKGSRPEVAEAGSHPRARVAAGPAAAGVSVHALPGALALSRKALSRSSAVSPASVDDDEEAPGSASMSSSGGEDASAEASNESGDESDATSAESGSSPFSQAIARAVAQGHVAAAGSGAEAPPRAHGRMVAAARPGSRASTLPEPGEAEDAPSGPLALPTLEEVQEKLRDVRVGADLSEESSPLNAPGLDARQARARLKQLQQSEVSSELSLSEQLGLKVQRVVIDAGHGGKDSGAIGPGGTREKDVALAIARQVAQRIRELGLEVVLTREDDTFVRLEDRAKIANRRKGDLFISIHCNSAANHALRGIETYTLNTSADRYSMRLAARENASSGKGISDLQFILADLATKANTEESTRLAQRVQKGLVTTLKARYREIRDLGSKEALFYVLLGAKMPAVLVETSFLSHPEEERRLGSKSYQGEVAAAIANGVQEFLGRRQRLAKMD